MSGENSEKEFLVPEVQLNEFDNSGDRSKDCLYKFKEKYVADPQFCVRAPGRVNLIGEHIDYCGYGVFPMAIEQDIFVAFGICENSGDAVDTEIIQLSNVHPCYSDFKCSIHQIKEILLKRTPGKSPDWYLYFLCGVQGVLDEIGNESRVSIQICIDGIVPQNAGLSSSSALVCAAALTTMKAFKQNLSKSKMAEICARSERYIGTQGGGMDQAICFLATAGTAQQIEFTPKLHGEKIKLPDNVAFVIANCLADANKAGTHCYNTRVTECRTSTWILGKRLGLEDFFKFNRLKDLQNHLGYSYEEMFNLIQKELTEENYGIEKISEILDVKISDLLENPLINKIPLNSTQLKLNQRARHVIQEAERVVKFRKACGVNGKESLIKLGKLMTESHWSLSELYECSHPYLDQLVEMSEGITYGARLTGAGWGGCMVALLDEDKIPKYMEILQKKFYGPIHKTEHINPKHVFITQPGPGAMILNL